MTRYCNNVHHAKDNETLTKETLWTNEYSINEVIKKLEENEYKIDEIYQKHNLIDETSAFILVDVPAREPEAKLTLDFIIYTRKMIADLYVDLDGPD